MKPPLLRLTPPTASPQPPTSRARRVPALLGSIAAGFMLTTATPLAAQQSDVAGIVVDGSSLTPLPLVRISVNGSDLTTTTDQRGRFRLAGVSSGSITLTLRHIGYRPKTETVTGGSTDLRIGLTPAPAQLEEVVVTGTADAVQRRTIGNAVSTISASDAVQLAPPQDVSNLINGKAPGVVVLQGSGSVGSGARIKIRGSSSVALNDAPLLYIDGVRINNGEGGGVSVQGFSSLQAPIRSRSRIRSSMSAGGSSSPTAIAPTTFSGSICRSIPRRGRSIPRAATTATSGAFRCRTSSGTTTPTSGTRFIGSSSPSKRQDPAVSRSAHGRVLAARKGGAAHSSLTSTLDPPRSGRPRPSPGSVPAHS